MKILISYWKCTVISVKQIVKSVVKTLAISFVNCIMLFWSIGDPSVDMEPCAWRHCAWLG